MIDIISATRLSISDFWSKSALGLSLKRIAHDGRLFPRIAFANQQGLPKIYNAHILEPHSQDLLVFVHDDVWIDDFFLADRVIEGLKAYDVIGVAGNRRRVPNQPAWLFSDGKFTWDKIHLSGSVAHGREPFGPVGFFGPVPAQCELLDGVLIAARKSALVERGVLFDPRFSFHFYDMDFCRSAKANGLSLGTWPICITHQSEGAFGTPQWAAKYREYLDKWKE